MSDCKPSIVHVIYALKAGGMENGLVNLLNRLPPDKYRHTLLCLTEADDFAQRIELDDVTIIELHKPAGHSLRFYLRLWQLFRQLRPALVHSRNLAALETQFLTLGLATTRVHSEHGRDVTDPDGSNWKYRLLRRLANPLIDRFITVSRDLQEWLVVDVGIPRGKVTQVYNGVDHAHFSAQSVNSPALPHAPWAASGDKVIVGTVGRLSPIKGHAILLQAIQQLLQHAPQWRSRLGVVLVGDGPLYSELAETARQLDIDSLLWMAGDRNDVPALLGSLQIFVLPSLGEGVSNTVLEAMSCGLPIVATEVGGTPELIADGSNGLLVPPADSDAIAHALLRLLDKPALRERLGAAAAEDVRARFSWDSMVAQYQRVYDELLYPGTDNRSGSID